MKYDDASWHYGGDYPKGLPRKNGATHIGMFLAWIIDHDLVSEEQKAEAAREIALVKKRKMTGARFLLDVCDEKLTDEDLSPDGNRFAMKYFQKSYLDDYSKLFGDEVESLYELADTWSNYDRLRPILDKRYAAFVKGKAKPKPKPKAKPKPKTKAKKRAASTRRR